MVITYHRTWLILEPSSREDAAYLALRMAEYRDKVGTMGKPPIGDPANDPNEVGDSG